MFKSTVLSLVALGALSSSASVMALQFVAFGDIPYEAVAPDGRTDTEILKREIAPRVRRNPAIEFVIHYGDSGRPEFACNDAWLRGQRAFWKHNLKRTVFFTPGDNDWTDCDRSSLESPTSELARLDALRDIMYRTRPAIDESWQFERQPAFRENALWTRESVQFATIHVVGTNNGRAEVLIDDPATALALVKARDAANKAWLNRAFAQALERGASAVVISTQADIFSVRDTARCSDAEPVACDGFLELREELVAQANGFGFVGPVLLIHGDTSAYCFDRPFLADGVDDVWRLNGPGDFAVIDAALITIDTADAEMPFKVAGLLSKEPPPDSCE